MKNSKRIIAVILSSILLLCMITPGFASENQGYTISNPYQNINWDTVNTYKTALHTHTNASDGDPTLKESIERHVECGFDIIATTDHGTVNYTWESTNENKLIHGVLKSLGRTEGELVYLGKNGTFNNGTSYSYATEDNGDDYLTLDSGKKIMRVPYGIEQNAISVNAHVNSWFVDYHNDNITTYKDAIKNVSNSGGVCVINHPGEYSKARYEIHSSDAYNTDNYSYWYLINKWAGLIDKYDNCIGIDINSKGDDRTRFDRIIWDELLTRFSSNGENVLSICSSDAHQLDKIDTGFTYMLMPEMTSSALKTAMLNGEYFGASHCIGNPDELAEIASALKEFYGETELYNKVNDTANEMFKIAEEIDNGTRDADSKIGITYSVLDDDGYYNGTNPMITRIDVDDNADTITIDTENALIIRWISDGKLITTTKADGTAFNLNNYSDKIGNYVRAEVFGEGGVVYTQAFILNSELNKGTTGVTDPGFIDLGIFDFLLAVFHNWSDILGRMI